eukprot:10402313-Alexandrium_andersonii.AAC.1
MSEIGTLVLRRISTGLVGAAELSCRFSLCPASDEHLEREPSSCVKPPPAQLLVPIDVLLLVATC